MSLKCKGIFIVGAKRTPFCKYGGQLRELPASHAFAATAKDAIHTANVDPNLIDSTVVGNVHFLSQCDGGKTPRYCGIYAGVPLDKPALGVNKACGSGLQAIITSAVDILTGSAKVSLAGGTEIMSSLPFIVRNVRFGTTLGASHLVEDHMKREFPDSYGGVSLQRNAEELGIRFGVGREQADNYSRQSHLKWRAAQESNAFADELTKLTVTVKGKAVEVGTDEALNLAPDDLERLPALLDQGHIVTAGNSAAPVDGASALLLADEDTVARHNLRPLARVAGWACVGVHPEDTGLGAVVAVRRLVEDQGVKVGDVDLFEINETFATQVLIIAKELELDLSKINVSGGAIAIGHPVAASTARMVTHLAHQVSRSNASRGIAASSCGGGQGVAVMLEKI